MEISWFSRNPPNGRGLFNDGFPGQDGHGWFAFRFQAVFAGRTFILPNCDRPPDLNGVCLNDDPIDIAPTAVSGQETITFHRLTGQHHPMRDRRARTQN